MRYIRYLPHPRIISAYWAAWAWMAAFAYWGRTPSQLDPVVRMVPGEHVFIIWTAVAVLLTLGAVCKHPQIGRWLRIVGLAATTWLLVAWATAYFYEAWDQSSRMWVSAKNYLFLAIGAMATSPLIGRNPRAQPKEG